VDNQHHSHKLSNQLGNWWRY